jgi:hypothetical protein
VNKRRSWWLSQSSTTGKHFFLVALALFSLWPGRLSDDWLALIMHFGLEMAGAVRPSF